MQFYIKDTSYSGLRLEPRFSDFREMLVWLCDYVSDDFGKIDYEKSSYCIVTAFSNDDTICHWSTPVVTLIPAMNDFIYEQRL